MSDEDNQLLWGLPIAETTGDLGSRNVITGTVEFRNFEPIVQMMTVMELALGEDHPEEEWDDLCARFQVDPEEQRRFRAELRAELGADESR